MNLRLTGICLLIVVGIGFVFSERPATPSGGEAVDVTARDGAGAEVYNDRSDRSYKSNDQVALPPPADYEIIYLGSEICSYCDVWKREDYADWRRDPARRAVRVRLAEIETLRVRRGEAGSDFGRYQRTYERAFKDRRFAFPGFVLLNHGKIVRAGTGAGAWRRMARDVRREAELIELRRQVKREEARARAREG